MRSAKGFELKDVDNNVYIDFMNNYTVLIHGHNPPKVVKAVMEQIPLLTLPGAPSENQLKLAKIICERVRSVKKIRFCNSGSEATMMAVRAALAFTGKKKVLKMEGGYHGIADFAKVSSPGLNLSKAGSAQEPNPVLSPGIFSGISDNVLVLPFNNIESAEGKIKSLKNELAAVIVEPMLGSAGMIPANKDYLKTLREMTEAVGAMLVFDEVITFRLSKGGAQSLYGITSDITAFGKIIGGGYPVGAFGGRDDIMSLFDPSMPDKSKYVSHAGTFNANPITCIAGIATLNMLTDEAIRRINQYGDRLRAGVSEIFQAHKVKGQVTGLGSLGNVHFTQEKPKDYRDSANSDKVPLDFLHLSLLNHGVFTARRGMFSVSTPMSKNQVNQFIKTFEEALTELSPIIEKRGLKK
jgi:glutamate-1-semialdehyde 2,1-aminomutase